MKQNAEIFDLLQYLFDTTGFNDHQLHCVVRFKNKVDAASLEKAFRLLLDTVPMLGRVYRDYGGASYWEDAVSPDFNDLFAVVNNSDDFDKFTFSRTNAETGPQIKGCLLRSDTDALSVVANHMVMDGAGFKECVYLLSRLYSGVLNEPDYKPDFVIDGDRGYRRILSGLRLKDRIRILLFKGGDNNESGRHTFPMSGGDVTAPFICTHELPDVKYRAVVKFGKGRGVTVNDVILTAYFRVLSVMLDLGGEELGMPLMIDMRRYQGDKSFNALTNLASTEILRFAVQSGEAFGETLNRVAALTKSKKDNDFGLNSFVKLQTLFKLFGRKRTFRLLEKHLKNPNICMTNIGIIDPGRLVFGDSKIDNAWITGSIKYRPHFQMSLTTFNDKMTFAVNLYGDDRDRAKINEFFELMDRELEAAG